ncbi:hypothetical protein [Actinomyces qiguomingii]|uniref:hypothetical protein n=1 Tax=Actinomyces qiguomingii TaxID=2057800 RepID=UPI000FFEF6BE|nr:hypothetical protein [Actinomyces qiguomingii]
MIGGVQQPPIIGDLDPYPPLRHAHPRLPHHHTLKHEEPVILRIAENNSAVVLVSLAVVVWLGWGEVPPILAGVLGAAPSLNSLWGLRALRKAAA